MFALALWSALSFQKERTDAKLEALRSELQHGTYAHCMKTASRSRERLLVPDTEFKAPQPLDGVGMENVMKPFGIAISTLRANAAVDREELDLLWWTLSDWSSLLKRRLSTDKTGASAGIASGLEAGFLLRRIPATAHQHLVLRNVPSGNGKTLTELLAAVAGDRTALASAFQADNRISQFPAVFPLCNALRTGDAKDANAKVKRSIEDWAARALLEASISHLASHIPSVTV